MSEKALEAGQGEGKDTGGPSGPKPKPEGHWGWAILNLSVLALLGWALFAVGSCTWRNGSRMVANVQRESAEANRMYAEGVAKQEAVAIARRGEVSDTALISGAQIAIKAGAVDPSSVRFRNVAVIRQVNGARAVCGEFNAKNRVGGYSGFERFISAGVGKHTWIESEVADFGSAWASLCRS